MFPLSVMRILLPCLRGAMPLPCTLVLFVHSVALPYVPLVPLFNGRYALFLYVLCSLYLFLGILLYGCHCSETARLPFKRDSAHCIPRAGIFTLTVRTVAVCCCGVTAWVACLLRTLLGLP
jgi:hypothetical protein